MTDSEKEPKRGRGRPRLGEDRKRKATELLEIGDDDSDKPQNLTLRLSETVLKGPYKSQAERWNAYRKILDLQAVREQRGKFAISESTIEKHIGASYSEFEREIYSVAFQNHRLAKAAMQIQGTLADIAPVVRITLLDLSNDIKQGKVNDPKKQREYLTLISNIMEKFGVQKIDVSAADGQGDLNTEEAIAEGMRIVQELKGHENVIQWFTKVCTEPYGSRDKAKIDTPVNNSGTHENGSGDRPNKVVETVRLCETPDNESKEVFVDDRLQPIEQNGLVDNGFLNGGGRETP